MTPTSKKPGRPQKGLYRVGLHTDLLYSMIPYSGKYAIYALSSEDAADDILYIGYSCTPLNKRYNSHMVSAANNNNPKEQWLNQLLTEGKRPVLTLLEDGITYYEQARDKERQIIQYYIEQGVHLKNRNHNRPTKMTPHQP